ncbi:MAG: replication restart helicase PriA, partial [Myxococcota bacterium]
MDQAGGLAEENLVEVAVALPIRGTFTYRAGESCAEVEPGCRVVVPFGRRQVTGYVLGRAKSLPSGAAIKTISSRLDALPTVPAPVLSLCRWAADYYLHPLGEVIRTALPPGINVNSQRLASLTSLGRRIADGEAAPLDPALSEAESAAVRSIAKKKEGRRVGGRGGLAPALAARLAKKGLVSIDSRMAEARVKPRVVERVQCLVAAEDLDEALAGLHRAPVQAAMLEWLVSRGAVLMEELRAAFPAGRSSLERLVAREMARIEEIPLDRSGACHLLIPEEAPEPDPTKDQERALRTLTAALKAGSYSPFLLHGVTGSGKTEVYLRLISSALETGRGALVLVPEIALTPQLAGRFRARFGDSVAVLHSGLSEGERHDEWWRLRKGEAWVAVGVRSAVFAPVPELGVVVVDEEHDASFKQEEGLRYQARDLALVRGREAGAVVVLGSATPSMESLHNARSGRFGLLGLPCRVEGRPLPQIEVIDLRRDRPLPPSEL